MSYTKGHWIVRGNKIFIENSTKSIATIHVVKNYEDVTFNPIEDTEAIANAKLIAAAPMLLDACQNALRDIQKLNMALGKEGKHGYDLLENELNEAINSAIG